MKHLTGLVVLLSAHCTQAFSTRVVNVAALQAHVWMWNGTTASSSCLRTQAVLRLRNLANIDQNVSVTLTDETYLGGPGNATAGTATSARPSSSGIQNVTIPALQSRSIYFTSACSAISPLSCVYDNLNSPLFYRGCSPYVAWLNGAMSYIAGFRITVQEDRGALMGEVSVGTDVSGYTDYKLIVAERSINGGRAF